MEILLPPGTKSYCNVQEGGFLRFPFMCELACTRWQGNGNIVKREGFFFFCVAPYDRHLYMNDQ